MLPWCRNHDRYNPKEKQASQSASPVKKSQVRHDIQWQGSSQLQPTNLPRACQDADCRPVGKTRWLTKPVRPATLFLGCVSVYPTQAQSNNHLQRYCCQETLQPNWPFIQGEYWFWYLVVSSSKVRRMQSTLGIISRICIALACHMGASTVTLDYIVPIARTK